MFEGGLEKQQQFINQLCDGHFLSRNLNEKSSIPICLMMETDEQDFEDLVRSKEKEFDKYFSKDGL